MAIVTTDNQYYTAIANAIRGKNGTETTYKPSDMAAAITAIPSGGGGGTFNIDWENDVILTAISGGRQLSLSDGYTIHDIKLAILPTGGSTTYDTSTRWLFVYPGVITPEVITASSLSLENSTYDNMLPGIAMGAYGNGSQQGNPGIALYTIDGLQHVYKYSGAYNMRHLGLRSSDSNPSVIEGYSAADGYTDVPLTSSAGSVSNLIVGRAIFIMKNKEV